MTFECESYTLIEKADTTFNSIEYKILDTQYESLESGGETVVTADFYPRSEGNYYVVAWRGRKNPDYLTGSTELLLQRLDINGAESRPDFQEYRFMLRDLGGNEFFVPTSRPLLFSSLTNEYQQHTERYMRLDTPFGSFVWDDTDQTHKLAKATRWQLPTFPELGFMTHVNPNLGFSHFTQQEYIAPREVIDELMDRLQARMDGTTPTTEIPHIDPEPTIISVE